MRGLTFSVSHATPGTSLFPSTPFLAVHSLRNWHQRSTWLYATSYVAGSSPLLLLECLGCAWTNLTVMDHVCVCSARQHRCSYVQAARTINACATDVPLTLHSNWVLQQFAATRADTHPDACACRLRLFATTCAYNGMAPICPWDVLGDAYVYATSLTHVSPECRLSLPDEKLVRDRVVVTTL